ncbi:MAG: condensation domain-containing protein, partial [Dolichospermum sp.]
YWQQQLANKPPLLELPTDKPRPAIQSFAGATHEFKIDGDLTQQLRNLSQKLGVTSFHTLLTAFVVLLYRYTGQNDISVGCPVANRKQVAVETLIGFFVNTIVICNQIENNCQFSELVAQIRQTSLTANDHQDVFYFYFYFHFYLYVYLYLYLYMYLYLYLYLYLHLYLYLYLFLYWCTCTCTCTCT